MKISLVPAAEEDLLAAATFYEKTGSAAVAAKFISEFKRVAQVLLEFPSIGTPRRRGARAASLSLFPYIVIYRQTNDGITILVVKHASRSPTYGAQRSKHN
jgi:toxin ParE1/3/4